MLELSSTRKNKVNLLDYNSQQDIDNRMLIADLSLFEHSVLQEIFFSPLKISMNKLARNLGCEESDLNHILTKLSRSGLLSLQDGQILVDKEMRKYFEFHMKRFEPDFKPDMEYLQGILRKVPIHLLPGWYAIPRTSNNIFESIVEKYLLTPQVFKRYLNELNFANPVAHRIIRDVFSAPDCKVASSDLITKYNLKRQEFEEIILLLEFNFVCCLTYTRGEDLWLEWVSPFHEWHEYLRFLKATETPPIPEKKVILRKRQSDFAFVEDLGFLLKNNGNGEASWTSDYLEHLKKKAVLLDLAEEKGREFSPTRAAFDFLSMPLDKRALFLYRHPYNRLISPNLPEDPFSEKMVREAEKSLQRVLRLSWVYFDDFLKGSIVCVGDEGNVSLKKIGKLWKYTLPGYNDREKALLKSVVMEWLFESGMTAPGTCDGRDCFKVTEFGRFFFEE